MSRSEDDSVDSSLIVGVMKPIVLLYKDSVDLLPVMIVLVVVAAAVALSVYVAIMKSLLHK